MKRSLKRIVRKVEQGKPLKPSEIKTLQEFRSKASENILKKILTGLTLPLSLALGIAFSAYPEFFQNFSNHLPWWTNIPPRVLDGINYLWNFLGDTVDQANILYHIPNIFIYLFGFLGVKSLFEAINKKGWNEKAKSAKAKLQKNIDQGILNLVLESGHSLLFVGAGDFIGQQFSHNEKYGRTVTIATQKPTYTDIWNYYSIDSTFTSFRNVLTRSSAETAGEYVFFPVRDDRIFLPSDESYDLSAYKLDVLCKNIRTIEKKQKWDAKRIIIVGDRFHKSIVQSEDKNGLVKDSKDTISLETIAKRYDNITILDPTDIVLKKIKELAHGRKVVFRATSDGMKEFKKRFFFRLEKLGYKTKNRKNVLTIGYDLFEERLEQQTLSRKADDYYPVVLSKSVRDALIRNGYKRSEFIYVPQLVLETLSKTASQQ